MLSDRGRPEDTQVWLFFDDTDVYIAARAWDSSSADPRWIANEMRRDSFTLLGNDLISVAFAARASEQGGDGDDESLAQLVEVRQEGHGPVGRRRRHDEQRSRQLFFTTGEWRKQSAEDRTFRLSWRIRPRPPEPGLPTDAVVQLNNFGELLAPALNTFFGWFGLESEAASCTTLAHELGHAIRYATGEWTDHKEQLRCAQADGLEEGEVAAVAFENVYRRLSGQPARRTYGHGFQSMWNAYRLPDYVVEPLPDYFSSRWDGSPGHQGWCQAPRGH